MKAIISLVLVAALSGCASFGGSEQDASLPDIPNYPSADWVRSNLPAFQKAAEQNPSDGNLAAVERLQRYADEQGKGDAKMQQVNRSLSVAWGNQGRGGAAVRQSGYVHVLGDRFNDQQARYAAVNAPIEVDQATVDDALRQLEELTKAQPERGQGYSLYEISRWERYCDHGNGMDEDDWLFVTREGGESGLPSALSARCSPPDSDYQSYISAWTRYCKSQAPTNSDMAIVRNTSRPKTVVNPCEALIK